MGFIRKLGEMPRSGVGGVVGAGSHRQYMAASWLAAKIILRRDSN